MIVKSEIKGCPTAREMSQSRPADLEIFQNAKDAAQFARAL
jgi:hypothetical protein